MGTWGPGNFDSDNASEFLDSFVKNLVETIRNTLDFHTNDKSDDWFFESYGESQLMPATDLLLTIMAKYDPAVNSLTGLTDVEVNAWKQKYLKIFDDVIVRYSGDEKYMGERRKVIKTTFDELERLINEYDV